MTNHVRPAGTSCRVATSSRLFTLVTEAALLQLWLQTLSAKGAHSPRETERTSGAISRRGDKGWKEEDHWPAEGVGGIRHRRRCPHHRPLSGGVCRAAGVCAHRAGVRLGLRSPARTARVLRTPTAGQTMRIVTSWLTRKWLSHRNRRCPCACAQTNDERDDGTETGGEKRTPYKDKHSG